eukprot:TRINITY_DN2942_c0_g2_i1.p2 TRINITY_DN2942_c0_g2~~TRINITY_DN2942_c0_g2_i1.p2  ORF type:complete len:226 (-),score=21.31 TRINITY_DN2942_c0_g2_i1:14-691(-)
MKFIVLMMTLAVLVLAEPKLNILKAYYANKDVTKITKTYITDNVLFIIPSNDIFGDPLPGYKKSFVVAYKYGKWDVPHLALAMEGSPLIITKDTEEPIMLVKGDVTLFKAYYGPVDVTPTVFQLLYKGEYKVAATNNVFGDPLSGQMKTLAILYEDPNEKVHLAVALEGKSITLKHQPHYLVFLAFHQTAQAELYQGLYVVLYLLDIPFNYYDGILMYVYIKDTM